MKNVITFINMFKQLMAILNNKQKRRAIIVAFMAIFFNLRLMEQEDWHND